MQTAPRTLVWVPHAADSVSSAVALVPSLQFVSDAWDWTFGGLFVVHHEKTQWLVQEAQTWQCSGTQPPSCHSVSHSAGHSEIRWSMQLDVC